MHMRQVQQAAHGIRCVLHNKPPTQAGHLAPAAQNQPHTGGIHKSNAGKIHRQQFRHAGIDLRINFTP